MTHVRFDLTQKYTDMSLRSLRYVAAKNMCFSEYYSAERGATNETEKKKKKKDCHKKVNAYT